MLSLSNKLGLNNSKNPPSGAVVFNNLYSLDFDGVDDYVTFGDSNDFSFGNGTSDTPFSVSAWIKMADATKFRILSKSASGTGNIEWLFSLSGADKLALILYDNTASNQIKRFSSVITSDEGSWINVAATYNGSGSNTDINLYINGVDANDSVGSAGTYVAMHSGTAALQMGRFVTDTGGTSYANGNIDEVSLWNKELSLTETQNIYNSGTPTDLSSESNLVGYWRNGDTAGTSVFPSIEDNSANSNDGTMTNMDSGDIVTVVP